MNINIFLGEDNKFYIKQFQQNIKKWALNNDIFITINVYNQLTFDLVNVISTYDICFLDISIRPINGMEFARLIRKYNQEIEIIFVTNYKEFVLQGYEVNAFSYLVKPVKYQEISDCMNQLMRKINMKNQKKLIFKSDSILYCYNLNEIIYIEANLHSTIIRTLQQEIQTGMSFKQVNECLTYPPFYQVHRSYTVNMMHVIAVKGGMALTDIKVSIPISKKKSQEFKKFIFEFNECQLFH